MLTINLPPEREGQVRQNAAAQGADADTYASRLVLLALYQPVPPLSDEATRRESIYDHLGTGMTVLHPHSF